MTADRGGPTPRVHSLGTGDPLLDPAVGRDLASRYLLWDAFVAGERRVDLHPLVLPGLLHRGAVHTAEATVRIVGSVAGRALHDARERNAYGLHADVVRLAQASARSGDGDIALTRVDLLWGADGHFHPCEVNADCPGGHNEAKALPALAKIAGHEGTVDPTTVVESLTRRLAALARRRSPPKPTVGLVYATAYAEDLQVCAFLRQALEAQGIHGVMGPPTALHRGDDGAITLAGHPIHALYRFYPTEYLEGQRNLGDLESAVASGALPSVSAFAQMFLQSKTSMARTWATRDQIAPEDRAWVLRHLPATFQVEHVTTEALLEERATWVLKRALGRVGDEVFVGALCEDDLWRTLVVEVQAAAAAGEAWIAQRFVAQAPVPTPWGPRLLTLGAYVLEGTFVGYFARLTEVSHVSHGALCVPVFVSEEG